MHIIQTATPIEISAQYIVDWLIKQSQSPDPYLLFISGGSAIKIYEVMTYLMPINLNLKNLTVSLIDERYTDVDDSDSNGYLLAQTGFIDEVKKRGGSWQPILTGLSMEAEAERMHKWLETIANANAICFGQIGAGEDGHIAGILPQANLKEFEKTFPKDKYYTSYNVDERYPNPHKQRITITPKGLQRLNSNLLFITGEKKKSVLETLLTKSDEPVYEKPIVLLKKLENGQIITDIKVK